MERFEVATAMYLAGMRQSHPHAHERMYACLRKVKKYGINLSFYGKKKDAVWTAVLSCVKGNKGVYTPNSSCAVTN